MAQPPAGRPRLQFHPAATFRLLRRNLPVSNPSDGRSTASFGFPPRLRAASRWLESAVTTTRVTIFLSLRPRHRTKAPPPPRLRRYSQTWLTAVVTARSSSSSAALQASLP